ncbi:MAG: TonB-dependent receptor domain-containing protein, partial [Chitinophagaceae bacterium]
TVPGIGGEINLVGFSNNRQGVFSAIIDGNAKKYPAFSWRLQQTYKRGGNAKTPRYWLDNSGNEEINFSIAGGLKKQHSGIELFYSFFSTKLAIFSGSHIGNVTDLITAINTNEPPDYIKNVGFTYRIDRPFQQVQHQLVKVKAYTTTGELGKLNTTFSFQNNWRREFDKKRFQSSSNDPQLDLNIATLANDIVWDHATIHQLKGSIGVSTSYQKNEYQYRLFIPNYQAFNVGAFIVEKWNYKKWIAEMGVRYDRRSFFNTNSNLGRTFSNRIYNGFSGNLGIAHTFSESVQLTMNASTAWRAPQVNELYSDGLHHGAARLEKGDSTLASERANSIMASLTIQKKKWSVDIGAYLKKIDDFIYLNPVYPPELTIRGAFPTFRYVQANILMYGFDVQLGYEISSHVSWSGKATIVRAKNRVTKEWMIQMPADRFENAVQYNFGNAKFVNDSYCKIGVTHVLQQTRVPLTGNIPVTKNGITTMESDYLQPPPAYFLVGLEAGTTYQFNKHLPIQITVTVANLFNTVYREYLNAFRYYADEMGTNIGLKIKMPIFNKQ